MHACCVGCYFFFGSHEKKVEREGDNRKIKRTFRQRIERKTDGIIGRIR